MGQRISGGCGALYGVGLLMILVVDFFGAGLVDWEHLPIGGFFFVLSGCGVIWSFPGGCC